MLTEIKNVRQIKGEFLRRWFNDEYFDLIVWLGDDKNIEGFQLCYDISNLEHALTWKRKGGFTHDKIDQGESKPGQHKSTPILVKDGFFDKIRMAERFFRASQNIDRKVADFVYDRILNFPG